MRIEITTKNKVRVDGQPYAPAKDLARVCRLSPDYLTRLARTNQVKGVRVAGTWHLSLKSLAAFVGRRDPAKPATATDQSGLTTCATRTVNVVSAVSNTATTTDATSTSD